MLICRRPSLDKRFALSGICSGAAQILSSADLHAQRVPQMIAAQVPTTVFGPEATPAHLVVGLSTLVFAICAAIFVVVAGLLLYSIIRFRHRASDSDREPAQIYGSTQIELSWTVIPILLVVVLFLATARVIFVTERAHKPKDALDVVVIGHQYWWEFRYPKLGIVTANELHVPVSDPRHPTPSLAYSVLPCL